MELGICAPMLAPLTLSFIALAQVGASTVSEGVVAPEANGEPVEASGEQPSDAESGEWITAIDLLTIGPGEHLWTSFGHTAITVMKFNPKTREHQTTVYNWGDADFGGFNFVWSFFRGLSRFRLTNMGTMESVVNTYATLGRTMVQQRFALTPEQVQRVVRGLEERAKPEHAEYVYHHLDATCATKLRDFLDKEVLDGAIKAQLGDDPDPHTPRWYGRKYFAGFFFAEIFNDLFMGREHDKPWSKYQALTVPDNLSAYLQDIEVADPSGARRVVPLLSAPVPIVRDVPDAPYRGEGRSLIHIAYLLFALIGALGFYVLRKKQVVVEDAGFWLALWVVPASVAAVCMVFGALVSNVVEGRINELMLVYPITDLVLLPVAYSWWRGRLYVPRWLRVYAWVRLGGVALSLVGHGIGVLIQEPRVMVALAALCTTLFVLILHRMPERGALVRAPSVSTPDAKNVAA